MSAYEDDLGELVVDRKTIAKQYLQGWFGIDFISCIPASMILKLLGLESSDGYVTGSRMMKVAKIARLVRLVRVMKFIKLCKNSRQLEKYMDKMRLSMECK